MLPVEMPSAIDEKIRLTSEKMAVSSKFIANVDMI